MVQTPYEGNCQDFALLSMSLKWDGLLIQMRELCLYIPNLSNSEKSSESV